MKTAISLPDPLFHSAEFLAKRMGVSRSELFQRALQAYLLKHNDAGVTEELNFVYASGSYASGSYEGHIDLLLDQAQLVSLPKDEWS